MAGDLYFSSDFHIFCVAVSAGKKQPYSQYQILLEFMNLLSFMF